MPIVHGRPTGPVGIVTVGLVDRDHVGELEHPLLDPLQLVAGPREHEHQEEVDHVRDDRFGLAHTHRLDEDHVEPGGLAQEHGFARRPGDPTQRGARR